MNFTLQSRPHEDDCLELERFFLGSVFGLFGWEIFKDMFEDDIVFVIGLNFGSFYGSLEVLTDFGDVPLSLVFLGQEAFFYLLSSFEDYLYSSFVYLFNKVCFL